MIGPFVGRKRERAELLEGIERVLSGHGEMFLLVGEPGIGKTRLADAIANTGSERGLRVVWGRCWEGDGAPPYWPWNQVLRELGCPLPEGLAPTSDAVHARFVFFEAVTALLIEACRKQPLLLIVDDLHAADVSSLLLLQFVARQLKSRPVGIVGTYRDVDARPSSDTRTLLRDITREGTYLPLRRFQVDEVSELAARLGFGLSDPALAEILRLTEGNPLFVDHVVRDLPRGRSGGEPISISLDLRGALRQRFARVDDGTRALLEVVAVVGRDAPLPIVARAAALSATALYDGLQPALHAGLLHEQVGGVVTFSHVLLRDELYSAIPRDRRAALHASVAEAIERVRTLDPPIDTIAHHCLEGLDVVGAPRAAQASLLAAERRMSLLAFEDSAALLGRALEVLEGAAEPPILVDLLTARGLALLRCGELALGKQACMRAADLARVLGDVQRLARAALTRGAEFSPSLVDSELVALLEDCLARLPASERSLRARTLARLAAAKQPAIDPTVPMAMAHEALELTRDLDAEDRRAVIYSVTSALGDRGDVHERVELDGELVRLAMQAGDRVQALRAHARLVFNHMEAGTVALADAHLEAYATLATEFREPRYQWPLLLMRAMRALFEGRFDDVDRLHDQARALGDVGSDGNFQIAVSSQRFFRLLDDGRIDEAESCKDLLRATTARLPMGQFVLHVFCARLHTRRRDLQATRMEIAAVRELGFPITDPVAANLLAEPFAFAGERTDVERIYSALLPRAEGLVSFGLTAMVVDGPTARLLGLLARACGHEDAARRHFDDALRRLETLRAPDWLERTRREAEGVRRPPARAEPQSEAPSFAIVSRGDHFEVKGEQEEGTLKDSLGLRLLARLVEHPGREFHVLTLVAGDESFGSSDAGPMLDSHAIAEYRRRVEDLHEEVGEAESFGDVERASRKREELELLGAELARGVGLGGRERRAASPSERARINVQRHVKKAIRAISQKMPKLGRYLERSVKTGTYCRYDPA